MNDLAIEALGLMAQSAAVSASELAPGLRELVAEGVVWHGAALAFARDAGRVKAPRSGAPDLTAWECATSSFHLEDVVPVHVGSLEDGEPVIDEADVDRGRQRACQPGRDAMVTAGPPTRAGSRRD